MTRRRAGVMALAACLRGEMPPRVDWTTVVEIANKSWLTPTLFGALSRASLLDRVPDDVRAYLSFIHECNLARNRCLRDQLVEVLTALNAVGIEPILTKGTVGLFIDDDCRLGLRMMCDLDLQIGHSQAHASTACLRNLGYQDLSPCGVAGFRTSSRRGRAGDPPPAKVRNTRPRAATRGLHSAGPPRRADRKGSISDCPRFASARA